MGFPLFPLLSLTRFIILYFYHCKIIRSVIQIVCELRSVEGDEISGNSAVDGKKKSSTSSLFLHYLGFHLLLPV